MQRTAALFLCLGLCLAPALDAVDTASAQAAAEDYPTRNVTFLCPFPAGGGTDILTRLLAHELQDKLKRTFIVDNRPGAGTIVAARRRRAPRPTAIPSSSRRSPRWRSDRASTNRCPTTR
jgi:tripartite-type tricarboxylate transporter receptor subunit TctC